jgi:hypothetical protein
MKTKTKNKCGECGGELKPEEDRLVCSGCGRSTFSKALRHQYLERNKSAILKDLDILTREQVEKKWGIPPSTFSGLLRRWGHRAITPHSRKAPAAQTRGSDGHLPSFPEFSNEWAPEVQLAWFNGYLSLKK